VNVPFPTDLDPHSVTFLLGAGASRRAGLPLAGELLQALFDETIEDKRTRRKLWAACAPDRREARHAGDYLRFEMVMQRVSELIDGRLEFLDLFALATRPSVVQRHLASLSLAGARLVTVNFDDLLERAILHVGAVPRTVDAARLSRTSADVEVLKLHGSIWRHAGGRRRRAGGELQARIESIASRHTLGMAPRAAAALDGATHDRTLVVAGYSAGDDLDVVPTLRTMRPGRVVWIEHTTATPHGQHIPAAIGTGRDPVLNVWRDLGIDVHLVSGETSDVLQAIGLGGSADARHDEPRVPWRRFVVDWAERHRRAIDHGWPLASALFGDLERYDEELATGRNATGLRGGQGTLPWTPERRVAELAEAAMLSRSKSAVVQALPLARRALRLARQANDVDAEGNALLTLGRVHYARERPRPAETAFREALALTDESTTGWAQVAQRLANLLVYDGRFDESLDLLERAIPTFERAGFISEQIDARHTRGMILRDRGQLPQALAEFAAAEGLATLLPKDQQAFAAIAMRGECERCCGRLDSGEHSMRRALRIVQTTVAVTQEHAIAFSFLGLNLLDQDRPGDAADAFRSAIHLLRGTSEPVELVSACIARLHLAETHLLLTHRRAALRLVRSVENAPPAARRGEAGMKLRVMRYALFRSPGLERWVARDLEDLRSHRSTVFVDHCVSLQRLQCLEPRFHAERCHAATLASRWGNVAAASSLEGR
jgi:tetratricopeptide (TPR) repeat protein